MCLCVVRTATVFVCGVGTCGFFFVVLAIAGCWFVCAVGARGVVALV